MRMGGGIRVERTGYTWHFWAVVRPEFRKLAPHLYLQAYPSEVADSALSDFQQELQRVSPDLDTPHAWIADFAGILSTTAVQRKMFASHQQKVEAVDRFHKAGAAIFISNAVVRGAVTAVDWLKPPVYPYRFVSTREEALLWTAEQLGQRGVSVDLARARLELLRGQTEDR